jgi:hypothetical protein
MALCIEVVGPTLEAMGGEVVATGYLFGGYGVRSPCGGSGRYHGDRHRAGRGRWRVRGFEQQFFRRRVS